MKLFQSKIPSSQFYKVAEVLESGILGFGPNVPKFEAEMAPHSGKAHNIALNSASGASFLIYAFLKEKYGQCNVYTTPLGFTSPAWAARHHGHNLIFVDTNEELLMSPQSYTEARLLINNDFHNVVMPVLYGGVSTISDWELVGDETVVLDSAHCITPTLPADFVFFSFHPYKPVCSSDGGMISCDDTEAADYFRSYRNFGRSSSGTSYDIVQSGFKFYMNNLNATLGLISLSAYAHNVEARRKNFEAIFEECPNSCVYPHDSDSSYYFATVLDSQANVKLSQLGIQRNYPLLHKTTYYNQLVSLNYIEGVFDSILNVPIHQHLSTADIETIIKIIREE